MPALSPSDGSGQTGGRCHNRGRGGWCGSSGLLPTRLLQRRPVTPPCVNGQSAPSEAQRRGRNAVGNPRASYEPVQPTLAIKSEAAPGRNHGNAVANPRMRACSTVVSVPSPTLHNYSRPHPVLPEEKAMKQRLGNDHERWLQKRPRSGAAFLRPGVFPGAHPSARSSCLSDAAFRRHAASNRGNQAGLLAAIVRMNRDRTRSGPRRSATAGHVMASVMASVRPGRQPPCRSEAKE